MTAVPGPQNPDVDQRREPFDKEIVQRADLGHLAGAGLFGGKADQRHEDRDQRPRDQKDHAHRPGLPEGQRQDDQRQHHHPRAGQAVAGEERRQKLQLLTGQGGDGPGAAEGVVIGPPCLGHQNRPPRLPYDGIGCVLGQGLCPVGSAAPAAHQARRKAPRKGTDQPALPSAGRQGPAPRRRPARSTEGSPERKAPPRACCPSDLGREHSWMRFLGRPRGTL